MNQEVLQGKKAVVDEIASKIKDADSTVVVEYRGLTVAEISELRRNLRNEDVELKVYKNTMVSRAVEECGFDEIKEHLTGPNAFAFSKDATAPSRVLAKFAKAHEHLKLKSGIVEGKVVGLDTLKELANLPNREGMLSMLLSCLQSPVRSFACVVKAVADAKEANGGETPAAPAKEEAAEEKVAEPETKEEAKVEEAQTEEVKEEAKEEAKEEKAEETANQEKEGE